MLQPARFETGPTRHLIGISRHHPYSGMAHSIPTQWAEFVPHLPLPGQVESVTYGVICGHKPNSCEYMCAVEVPSFENIGPEWGRLKVLPQFYAVFEHTGPSSRLRETWEEIHQQWLPNSEYVAVQSPDFERYDSRFNPITTEGGTEIWFPVAKKN